MADKWEVSCTLKQLLQPQSQRERGASTLECNNYSSQQRNTNYKKYQTHFRMEKYDTLNLKIQQMC